MSGNELSLNQTRFLAALNGVDTTGVVPKKLTPEEQAEKARVQEELRNKLKLASAELSKTDSLELNGKKNKENRETRLKSLTEYYQKAYNMSEKDAKHYAKETLKDEKAEQRVSKTKVYYDKKLYDANKKSDEDKGIDANYIKDKDVRKAIENNKVRFFIQNEDGSLMVDEEGQNIFSDLKYKNTMLEYTGDHRLELQERKDVAAEFDVSKGDAKKMAKYANLDIEKDDTWLMRGAAAIGSLGLSTIVGGVLGMLNPDKINVSSFAQTLDKETMDVLEDSLKTANIEKTNTQRFSAVGALSNLIPAIGLSMFIKDRGKDSILETSAENIVKNGVNSVKGDDNKKLVAGILELMDAAGLKEDQKVRLIEITQGIAGGHTTERELAVLARDMKEILTIDENTTQVKKEEHKVEYDKFVTPETVTKTETKTETEKVFKYGHQAGEYWIGIAKNMYGVDDATASKIGREIKKRHGFKPSDADMPKIVNLPHEITIGDKTYNLKINDEKDIVRNPYTGPINKGTQVASSSFKPKTTTQEITTSETVYNGFVSKKAEGQENPEVKADPNAVKMNEEQKENWLKKGIDYVKSFFKE